MAGQGKAQKSGVKMFHRVNKLKMKAGGDSEAGAGFIDKASIRRAQAAIDDKNDSYGDEIQTMLTDMEGIWKAVLADNDEDMCTALYHKANHIKDLAETYNYELMHYFGKSLREFIEKLDVNKKPHQIIVRAHIDVMWVVYDEKIKENDDEKAQELKEIVIKAIEKHS